MSNAKGPEVLASEPNIQDTLKGHLSQEGSLTILPPGKLLMRFFITDTDGRRTLVVGPDVNLLHQSAYPSINSEQQTALKGNPLDRILDKITARFRLGLTTTFGLGAAVLPVASTFAQVEQQEDDNNENSAEIEGVENETNTAAAKTIEPIDGRALEARAEILEFPQNFDLDLISRRNRQYPVGLTGGRFFTETAGFPLGFAVTNDERFQVWQAVSDIGGIQTTGYPLSNRVDDYDGIKQLFQNGMLYISSKPEDFDSVTFTPNSELPEGPHKLLPQEVFKPIHADAIPLPDFIVLKASWNTLDLWKEAAEKARKPVWQFLWEHQIQHIERFGKPMMIPDIPQKMWGQWAAETKMNTVDLGFKIFFGQTPQELLQNMTDAINTPLQKDCLEQVNQIRSKYGLSPITKINPYAILTAQAQVINNLVHFERLGSFNNHAQLPTDIMFTGENINRRMKRFGAPADLAAGDIISFLIPTSMALWAWGAPSHRPALLAQPLPGFPLEVGYAEGRMGSFMQAVLVSARRF